MVSFLALREFVTLTHTRRGDHRSLLLAFFVVLPVQYVLVGDAPASTLFTVFIPVYVFLAIPVVSALANDPHRFLERTAKIQWGIMVCVYGMSHAPALLLLDLPRYARARRVPRVLSWWSSSPSRRSRQEAAEPPAAPPAGGARDQPLVLVARLVRRRRRARRWSALLLYWTTPFKPLAGAGDGRRSPARAGTLGEFVMKALKRDAGVRSWRGNAVGHRRGRPARPRRAACFAAPVFFHSVRWYFGV